MQVEVRLEPGYTQPRVVIHTETMTDEVKELLDRIGTGVPQQIVGFLKDEARILPPEQIVRIYAENKRVFAVAERNVFTLKGPLYEWEQRLDPRNFVRISQSEIISLRHVEKFDLSISGTICVRLRDGSVTHASRRYVAKIKTMLGL